MLLAAAAALIGTGSAYANDSENTDGHAITQFTQIPSVIAQVPPQNAPLATTLQSGQAAQVYVTRSNQGTWLFPPAQGSNG